MQKVVTVSLNGNPFALEEEGFAGLSAYLGRAESQLKESPDRAEIMADLEQAIADKCTRFLTSHKTLIAAAEMNQILTEMGPVENADGSKAGGSQSEGAEPASKKEDGAQASTPKRLYRILEGGMLGGICNGLGAYFHVDPNILRAAFVILAFATHGILLLVYVILMFVIPIAKTSEEKAAASGLPFTAQRLIDRAKKEYAAAFKGKQWTSWGRDWQHGIFRSRRTRGESPPAAPPYPERVTAGLAVPILAMISAALSTAWAVAAISLVAVGSIFGWQVPAIPLWAALLILVLFGNLIAQPLREARHALRRRSYSDGYAWPVVWDGLLHLCFVGLFMWLAYQHFPEVRHFFDDLPGAWEKVRASWTASGS